MTANELQDKMLGCIAGVQVGSALADPVETWTIEEIEEEYGWLDYLDSREEYGEVYPPGTTEDGVERLKLQILSIIDNGGPITSRDLGKTWIEYVDTSMFGKWKNRLAGQQDEIHFRLIEAGIPPEDSGYHDAHPGRVGPHRASHANGVVNACYPALAAKYAIDVARIYQPPKGRGIAWEDDTDRNPYGGRIHPTYTIGLDWSAAVCAGVAEAMKPSSTKESVVEEATKYVVPPVRKVLEQAVEIGEKSESYSDLRDNFYEIYNGRADFIGMDLSRANEIVPKGLGLFVYYEDDVQEVMEGAANFGRDTDCLAAIAAGFAGAFHGSETIPDNWIDQVDKAAKIAYEDDRTCTDMSLEEQAEGLYESFHAHHESLAANTNEVEKMM